MTNCAWEPEHGLQLVLREGRSITKLGPYDGHLTHSDAFARADFAGIVYVRHALLFPDGALARSTKS